MTDTSGLPAVVAERMAKRESLIARGIDPYPHEVYPDHSLSWVRENYGDLEPDTLTDIVTTVAGRVMFKRSNGKIGFATLQEGDGTRLQIMFMARDLGLAAISRGDVVPDVDMDLDAFAVQHGKAVIKDFERSVDLGDFVSVVGAVATSIKGELSLRAHSWALASKGILPLPFLHAELSDEMRVRQPYAHMIQSQEARDRIRDRSRIIRTVRRHFEDQDFTEVETPILQPIHGGAMARPFKTHVNALDQEFSLRIALELPLKKAVVAGVERVFELAKVFRNEGIDTSHSPEFTMLEAYQAYGDIYSMAEHTQWIFRKVAAVMNDAESERHEDSCVNGAYTLTMEDGVTLDFTTDFAWLSVYEALAAHFDIPITSATTAEELRLLSDEHGVSVDPEWSAGKIIMELCSEFIEPTLIQPTFLHDWPAEAQPLARRNPEDARRVLAWDLIVNGVEVATSFTELVDPVLQREILTEQSLAAANGDPEAMQLDEDFLRALGYGCPPMGGLGIGIDRLVMLFTQSNIREVTLFPLMKKEVF